MDFITDKGGGPRELISGGEKEREKNGCFTEHTQERVELLGGRIVFEDFSLRKT